MSSPVVSVDCTIIFAPSQLIPRIQEYTVSIINGALKETTANRCNLIDNGDFYFGSTQGFTGSGTTLADELTTVGTSVYVPVRYAMMVITDFADVYTTPKVSAETKITSIFKNECVVANAFLKDSSGNLWY